MATVAQGESGAPALAVSDTKSLKRQARLDSTPKNNATAIVYCEGNFGGIDGKTANGLVRHSEKYKILSIVDSEKAGLDSGVVLDGVVNGIPVYSDLLSALAQSAVPPQYFIYGCAPASGRLSLNERGILLRAIDLGLNIVSGLHEYLSDDEEFVAASQRKNVTLTDVRKARPKSEMHTFSGQIERVTCPRIAVLGTDCAIGKRTTATVLTRALNDYGLKAVMIGTGQTGLIQGAKYGVALDAVPSQFCAGELEATIVRAFDVEKPDVIIVEGQGALSHPAYSTTSFILRGSKPDGVILQHAPARKHRCDFAQMAMPDPAAEIHLIETFSDTRVIGLNIHHEHMLADEVNDACAYYQKQLGIPVTDALVHLPTYLVDMFLAAFPNLCVESLVKVH